MNAKISAMKKRVLSWLMVLMMVIAMIPATTSIAGAADADTLFKVKYLDETESVTERMWNEWIADDSTYRVNEYYSIRNGKGKARYEQYLGVKVCDIYYELFGVNLDELESKSQYEVIVGSSSFEFEVVFADRYVYEVKNDGVVAEDAVSSEKVYPIISNQKNEKGELLIGMQKQDDVNQQFCLSEIFSSTAPAISITIPSSTGEGESGSVGEMVVPDTSWNNDKESSFTLSDEADLAGFAKLVNEGVAFEGKTVTLANDISLTKEWTSIGDASHAFKGTFDGKGYTISGLKITGATDGYKGLFGNSEGTVKNFNLEGSIGAQSAYITSGNDNIGGAVGYNNGTVKGVNANVSVHVNTGKLYAIGGVVGQNGNKGVIEQCINTAYVEGTKCTGGIAGRSYGIIRECVNTGEIKGNGGGKDGIGGICGLAGDKDDGCPGLTIRDCYNTGTISNTGGRWHGGIAGFADDNIVLQNCYDIGKIVQGYDWNWNPIVGHTDTVDLKDVLNNYFLDGLLYGNDNDNAMLIRVGIIKTEAEFKTQEMVDLLGSNWAMDSYNKNNGYPVLKWQNFEFDKAAADEVIKMLPSIDEITGEAADIEAIKAAEVKYEALSDEAKELVEDALKAAKEKVAAINHTSNGVTIKGLDWDKKVFAELKTDGIEYDDMKTQAKAKTLLAMYDITVCELTNSEWVPCELDKDVEVTIINDKFTGYINAAAIHQMERVVAEGYDYETISAKITGNKVVFTTDDFSNYGIVADKAPAVDNATKTGDDFNVLPVLAIMLLAIAGMAVVLYRRKHTN